MVTVSSKSCWFSRLHLLSFSSSCLWPLRLGCYLSQGAFSSPLDLDGMFPLGPHGLSWLAYSLCTPWLSPLNSKLSNSSRHLLFAWWLHVQHKVWSLEQLITLVMSADVPGGTSPCLWCLASSAWSFLSPLICLFGSWDSSVHRSTITFSSPLLCSCFSACLDHCTWSQCMAMVGF